MFLRQKHKTFNRLASQTLISSLCLEPSKAPACKTVSVGNGAMGWRSVGASLAEIRMKEGWHEKQRSNIARPEERKLARWILGVLGKSRYRCDGFFFFFFGHAAQHVGS